MKVMGKYDDIINLPHYMNPNRIPMPLEKRAAQFAPFAALSGHDDALAETARLTENWRDLSENEKDEISHGISLAIHKNLRIRIRYFCPDERKAGGKYRNVCGFIKQWDEIENRLIMHGGDIIPIPYISEIMLEENVL